MSANKTLGRLPKHSAAGFGYENLLHSICLYLIDSAFLPQAGMVPRESGTAMMAACSLHFKGHTDEVWGAKLSPDGEHIVTASADHTAQDLAGAHAR
jgi:WD40 repeat protein